MGRFSRVTFKSLLRMHIKWATIEKLLTTLEILSLYMACVLQGAELIRNETEKVLTSIGCSIIKKCYRFMTTA